MNLAGIIVLPKSGKGSLYLESYRPIPLLNSDVKILLTVLANRLSKVMVRVVLYILDQCLLTFADYFLIGKFLPTTRVAGSFCR